MAAVNSKQQGLPFVTLLFLKFAVLYLCLTLVLLLITSLVAPSVPIREAVAYSGYDTASNEHGIVIVDMYRRLQINLTQYIYHDFYGWSADGRFIFTSNETGDSEIYLWDGLTYLNLSEHPLPDWQPVISHDGKVAFTSERDGNMEIYVWQDGTLTNLTQHPASDQYPAWSADGRLAFVSTRNGLDDIIIWDGSSFININQTPSAAEWLPSWSPDGRLAFLSKTNNIWELWVWDRNQLISIDTHVHAPNGIVWSSDGRLAYSNTADIWVWDGNIVTNITNTSSQQDYTPAWRTDGTLTYITVLNMIAGTSALMQWDGNNLTPLIQGYSINSPRWTP